MHQCFNPVLGFLSASTVSDRARRQARNMFQSRSGFSECFDEAEGVSRVRNQCFNPVLGFLSASTCLRRIV